MISPSAKIHPTAIIEDGATIGDNSVIGPYCCIGPRVIIKSGVILQSHVVIQEDTTLEDGVQVFPFASLGQKPQDLKYAGERSSLEIGKNTVIREYVTASIGTKAGGMVTKIGSNCLIMAYCHIAHDCIVGNNVIFVNGVNIAGHVVVGDNAIIGGMSAVKQFTRIGHNAMIGGCTGVNRDIIPYGLVRSNRLSAIHGLNVIGLRRKGFSIDAIETLTRAYKDIFESDDGNMTNRVAQAREVYANDPDVLDILDFISAPSKNPICTTIPTDSD